MPCEIRSLNDTITLAPIGISSASASATKAMALGSSETLRTPNGASFCLGFKEIVAAAAQQAEIDDHRQQHDHGDIERHHPGQIKADRRLVDRDIDRIGQRRKSVGGGQCGRQTKIT
ncbi:hypothetical protein EEB11_16165 [Pseudotabrizicola sediminis]|uniref:Uncharacterized protein n=1 Tax=Pseudotabrizicola sediminis TaxID=2486418 RepID=A0ABY2KKZ7_9RHOB|nr:hypothetical protein EEB11_16165 [Pseudotabrizicola sediminis]